jgi:DMSO/TMAO reductase YedYZ molybdopterin-dependent catalytic subunit
VSDSDQDKLDRIVAARMKLKARFEAKMAATPSQSDSRPLGTGPTNRHGMPQLPVGQIITQKWPVLDLGVKPRVDRDSWSLTIDGAVAHPTVLRFADLLALEQVEDISDFHCVTTWSKLDMRWTGVRFSEIAALVEPDERATHVMVHGYDGYETNVALEEALKPDVLIAHTVFGEPLPHEHGGPVRMITPQLYAWKGAKWIRRIEFLIGNRLGFWEQNGYSNTALPWRNDRYSR